MDPTSTSRPSGGALALLGGLYLTQGLPFGFQATALPVYLREHGVGLASIGLASGLALPWMLKVLWAPLVDRHGSARFGRRRSWIVPLQLLMATCCLAAAALPPDAHLGVLLGLTFLLNLLAATQDIAVDGLAVDLLSARELGMGNAAQVVGYKLGMITGGGLLVWASSAVGWGGLFVGMAALILAVTAMVLRFEEAPSRRPPPRSLGEVVRGLLGAVRLPGARWLLAVVLTYKLGESIVDTMFKPFLVDSGFEAARIGLWVGTWGLGASIIGSGLGGALAMRIPLVQAVTMAAILRSAAMAGEWWLAATGPTAAGVIAVTLAESAFGGLLTTAMFALMMDRVDRRVGATHFTLLATVEVLGKLPAGMVSGVLVQRLGYAPTFAVGLGLSVAFLGLMVPALRPAREG